jgi:hypothetical protein
MNTRDRLAEHLRRALSETGAAVSQTAADIVEVTGASTPGRQIEVHVRDESDFEVAFHVVDKQGSPFEQVIVGDRLEAADVEATVVRFVADLVTEELVLAMVSGVRKGGRCFLPASQLQETDGLRWVVSWRGTHDRN